MRSRRGLNLLATLSGIVLGLFAPLRIASAQTYVFNEAEFGTGQGPQALIRADFNGDGIADLAVANQTADTVSVLLGCGSATPPAGCVSNLVGTFGTKIDFAVGTSPVALVADDFNADGKMDLAVVNSADNTVSIFLGNGDGTFSAANGSPITVGTSPQGIASGDFDGNGKVDLAVTNSGNGTVTILLGNGDGTFIAATSPSPGSNPRAVAAADFDGNGTLDLAVSLFNNSAVAILLGNGDGTFASPTTYQAGLNPIFLTIADFNGDGLPDIAAADNGTANVSVLLNKGTNGGGLPGTFPNTGTLSVLGRASGIVSGDFNGDGFVDLAVTSQAFDSISVALGNGNGTFGTFVNYASGLGPSALLTADLNGDDHLDLAIANFNDNNITVVLGNGDGSFQTSKPTSTGGVQPFAAVSGDFNENGGLDLAVVNNNCQGPPPPSVCPGAGSLSVLLGNNDGTFSQASGSPITLGDNGGNANPQGVAAGDLNGDTHTDVVVSNFNANTVDVFLGNGDGTFAAGTTVSTLASPLAVALADVNGDGKLDLLVTEPSANRFGVFLGNGDGTFGTETDFLSNSDPVAIVTGDFNGDLIPDVAVANGNQGQVSVLLNTTATGSSTVSFAAPTGFAAGSSPAGLATADLSGDGVLDLAVANTGSSTVSVLLGVGDGTFNAAVNYATAVNPFSVAVGDFDGDGHPDLAVGATGQNTNAFSVLLGNGDGTFQEHVDHLSGFKAQGLSEPVVAGDFNTDGTSDVAAVDEMSGNVVTFLNLPSLGSPTATLSTSTLTFGGQLVGTSSTAQTVTLTNSGTAALSSIGVSITGANAADFSQTNTCDSSVNVGANCMLTVTFTPTASGSRSATLSISDNAGGSPQTVALSGTGTAPVVSLAPASLAFPNTLVSSSSAVMTITLTNAGNAALSLSPITITGANAGDFTEGTTCPSSVAAGASCTVNVTFKPTASGSRSATLTLTDNDGGTANSMQTIALTGTGTAPVVSLAPASLTFPSTLVNTSSAVMTATLTNTGNAALSLSPITITGTNAGDFTEGTTCPSSVAAGASCTVNVTFKPTASGTRTATVTLTDNDGGISKSTQAIALTGTATANPTVSLSPASLAFASTIVGKSSAVMTVTLTNTGGAALTLSPITITGANAADFTEGTTCPSSVAAGASCTVNVTFKPTVSGSRSASLTFTDNNNGVANSEQTVSLTGMGADFTITSSPSSDTVTAGSSAAYTLTISPAGGFTGTVALTCSSSPSLASQLETCTISPSSVTLGNSTTATVTVTTTAEQTSVPPAGFHLPPMPPLFRPVLLWGLVGMLLALMVRLQMASRRRAGIALATTTLATLLWVACGGGTSVNTNPPPTSPKVSLSPSSLTFANQNVNTTSAAQTVTLSNTGNATLSITSIAATGDYAQTNSCGSSLSAGASCMINVTFTPTTNGTRAGTISVTDNASGSPQSVSLTGDGVVPGTPAGTSTLTFTGTSGSLSHSATGSLTVQ